MVVVGGIKPSGTSFQPWRSDGCDTDPQFSQGLGIFSFNSHTWTTNYDPAAGADPYYIHPSISKVIGGNRTGGATKRTPNSGFSSDALRMLMSSNQQTSNKSFTAAPTGPPNTTRKPRLSSGAIAGTAIGVAASAILVVGIVSYILYRRRFHHEERSSSASSASSTSRPTQPSIFHEVYAAPVGQELRSGRLENALARRYQSHEVSNTCAIYEMPTPWARHELPVPAGSQAAAKVPLPESVHPALVDEEKRKRTGIRQQTGTNIQPSDNLHLAAVDQAKPKVYGMRQRAEMAKE